MPSIQSFFSRLMTVLLLTITPVLAPPVLSQSVGVGAVENTYSGYSQDELDALLAPVALYPDQLLAQVLMAATYPLDVVEAARFVKQNPNLKGEALDNVLANKHWDPSVLSLAAFSQVLDMMNDRLDWTRQLGEAFLADEDRVMQTVQQLRARAQQAGHLYSSSQQNVIIDNNAIIIEPAQPDVIYIPSYNPTVVYGSWWAPAYVPFYWQAPSIYYPSGIAINAGLFAFSVGYKLGHNHWWWARPDWRQRRIAVDFNRHNRFIDRRPRYREHIINGHWRHRPEQRQGIGYRNPALRQHFGQHLGGSVQHNRTDSHEGRRQNESSRRIDRGGYDTRRGNDSKTSEGKVDTGVMRGLPKPIQGDTTRTGKSPANPPAVERSNEADKERQSGRGLSGTGDEQRGGRAGSPGRNLERSKPEGGDVRRGAERGK